MGKVKIYPVPLAKAPQLKKLGDGVYTIAGYTRPKPATDHDVRRIVKNLLTPIKVSAKG